ncbi:MAG TPA: DNA repair protein RecO [Patescibacteria group bacterium]|nr:DNA repair protein RecO [Patescibacteria group bacterium]
MIKSYSSEALVLLRRNYSEADRILTVYSSGYGKLSLLAKGVRKLRSRKRSSVEVFTLIKFSASKSKGMDIMTEAQTVTSYQNVRSDLKKVAVAYFFCETLEKVMPPNEENNAIFQITKSYFEELGKSSKLKTLRYNFISDVLVQLGFWPFGKKIPDPDRVLEQVVEKKMNSRKVGKKLLS